jgi:uncharacterized tellurite resistance protein B-like protein
MMLDALRNFIRLTGADAELARPVADAGQLALAALLIHSVAIDGVVNEPERAKLRELLTRNFGLSGADLDVLIKEAADAESEAVDLYRFTSVLKRQMSEEERIRVIENLWEMTFADGTSHEFEENLVWRVAELLGVHRRDRIATRRSVAENKSARGENHG